MTSITLPLTPARSGILHKALATDRSSALFVLRLALGLVILPHGLQKAFGWFGGYGFQPTLGFFATMGIPAFLGVLVILTETLGSLALIAGIGTRLAAFATGSTMVVAALMVHRANGFFMNWAGNQKGEGFEFHILATAIAAALVIGGAGRWSADRALASNENN